MLNVYVSLFLTLYIYLEDMCLFAGGANNLDSVVAPVFRRAIQDEERVDLSIL